ncbi:MAG: MucR family transcriptional regulator [Pseudomonadota bacterium]
MDRDQSSSIVDLTAEIVSAFVSHNEISPGEVSILITNVSNALRAAAKDQPTPAKEDLKPAVPIKKSIFPDYIICLEDGKKYKSLKRHLRTRYNLTPEEYRDRWGLPHEYPMVAPNYRKARSAMAKRMGLGTRRR